MRVCGCDVKIPNGEHADLGTKIEDYALNQWHREGSHKARVFESVLSITTANKAEQSFFVFERIVWR